MRRLLLNGCVAVFLALFAGGCARKSAFITPGADVSKLKTFYVVQPENSEIYRAIQVELTKMGYEAGAGPAANAPANVDAIVSYDWRWMWDITMYLLELKITIVDPKTTNVLATGESYRPSLQRKDPNYMAREILDLVLKPTALPSAKTTTSPPATAAKR